MPRPSRLAVLVVALAAFAAGALAACGSRTALDVPVDAAAPVEEPEAASCGPWSCAGCCDDAGTCLAGDAQAACGEQGRACVACLISENEICNPQPGQPDERVCWEPCDPRFCLRGCCLASGQCVSLSDTTCGDQGRLCIDCTATGEVCGLVNGKQTCTSP